MMRRNKAGIAPGAGICGRILLDQAGLPIWSDFSPVITERVATRIMSLLEKARTIIDCLDEGSVHFLKLETSHGEILVEPEVSKTLITLIGENE